MNKSLSSFRTSCLSAVRGSFETRSEAVVMLLQASIGKINKVMHQEAKQSNELCSLAGLAGREA